MGRARAAEVRVSLDLLISGGTAVLPTGTEPADLGMKDGTIAVVAPPGRIDVEAERTIDATGKLVLPGGIEPHAHIHEPMYRGWTQGEEVWLQSPEGATRAAAFGGTTTVVSFAFMAVHVVKQEFDAAAAVAHRRDVFSGRSYTDFAFHPVLTGTLSAATIASVGDAIDDGTASMKLFTTDLTTGQAGIRIDNGSALAVMQQCAAHGALVMVHAEDDDLIKFMEAKLTRHGRDQLPNVHLVHTPMGEELAVRSVARLAQEAGAAVYIAHVGAREPMEAIGELRAAGRPVYGEALHNLLCFSTDDYAKADGAKYHIGMGLKPPEHPPVLWEGLADGRLSTIATDEYTTSFAVKMAGTNIQTTPGGHVGIETRGIITFSEGYVKGRITLERFVEVFSTNPARLLGIYPQKGTLAAGSDADIVIWDPTEQWTITLDDLHHESDYSPWEGWEVTGRPVTTILRGQVIVEDGKLLGAPKDGRWLRRTFDPELAARPALG
jgi:dihydropyrimidinase